MASQFQSEVKKSSEQTIRRNKAENEELKNEERKRREQKKKKRNVSTGKDGEKEEAKEKEKKLQEELKEAWRHRIPVRRIPWEAVAQFMGQDAGGQMQPMGYMGVSP